MILRTAIAILIKELRCEIRTRQGVFSLILFSVTSVVAASYALGAWGSKSEIAASILWLMLYFSAVSGMSRTFIREEEIGTSLTLRSASIPNGVFLGKLAYNTVLLIIVEAISLPLLVLFSSSSIADWTSLAWVMLMGGLCVSLATTIGAAMVSRASSRGSVFAIICFPILLPALSLAIHGTTAAMSGEAMAALVPTLRLMFYYCGSVLVAGLMLFRYIWEN